MDDLMEEEMEEDFEGDGGEDRALVGEGNEDWNRDGELEREEEQEKEAPLGCREAEGEWNEYSILM